MKTPKQKAKELIKRYSCLSNGELEKDWIYRDIIFDYEDTECAIIAVDEILKAIPNEYLDCWQGESQMVLNEDVDYWQEVKQEIIKLQETL